MKYIYIYIYILACSHKQINRIMGCIQSRKVKSKKPSKKATKQNEQETRVDTEAVETRVDTEDETKLSKKDLRDIITNALEGELKGYKVYGQAIPPGILEPIRVLKVKRHNEITVTPDSTGRFLTHGLLNTKYDLYAAVNRTINRVVFLYQWEALRDQIFVTCPYSQDPTDGSIIPCAETDITNALKEEDPERAVMHQLEKIITGNSEWVMDGPDNDFTISVPGEEMFWRDIEGFRNIMLTDNDRIKLVLELEVVAGSPVPLK